MRILRLAVIGTLLWLAAGPAIAQGPPAFVLLQNVPNPFCPGPDGDAATTIQFATPQTVELLLAVWTPDGTALVKTLVNGTLPAGYHTVIWDGRDELGTPVEDASYPYRMTAREPGGGAVVFEQTLVAIVTCADPVRETTWGVLRSLFGWPRR